MSGAVLLDALGTLLELEDPGPALADELAAAVTPTLPLLTRMSI